MGRAAKTLTLDGRRYVILPEAEYRQLRGRPADLAGLELPPAGADGNYPALRTMQVLIARDIVRARQRLGLSQAELARRAGIRVETLNRIEAGKHSPSIPTVDKIDRAFKRAKAERKAAKARNGK